MTVWYRAKKVSQESKEKKSYKVLIELILWVIPAMVVVVMGMITWDATHKLDPYKPLEGGKKPLVIQVVALSWKWLFIYPEQGIATVNFVQLPVGVPIRFELSADGSPMNSFWIPQLSGQIYAMTGMVTTLHVMANIPGEYIEVELQRSMDEDMQI